MLVEMQNQMAGQGTGVWFDGPIDCRLQIANLADHDDVTAPDANGAN